MKIVPVGLSLSLFLAISFALLFAIHFYAHTAMSMDMASSGSEGQGMMGQGMMGKGMMEGGMAHHGPAGFFIGLGVSYALGWYTAFVFVPLFNLFNKKSA